MPLSAVRLPALSARAQVVRGLFLAALTTITPVALTSVRAIEAASAVEPPWQDVLNTSYTAASDKLHKLHEADPSNARYAVAYAASLLSRDPTTRANVRKSRAILEKIVADLPTSYAEHRPIALYLLGRISHDHFDAPEYETARGFYQQLRTQYPQHPLADQAAVQLMLLLQQELPQSRTSEVVAAIEAIIPTVTDTGACRDLHGRAASLYEDPLLLNDKAGALRHILAARELGSVSFYADAHADLQIAGLARQLGMNALAAKHYRAFAAALPRDDRVHTALRLARELEEEVAPLNEQP